MKGMRRGLAVVAVCGLLLTVACAPPRSSRIAIGAKNFTEQVVLGELMAQEIEAVTGQPVERRFYLAGSYLCQQALVSGRIDGYVEYTGTALTAILKQPLPPVGQREQASVFAIVRKLYEQRYQVRVDPGLGFQNTFAMVVRGEDAQRLHLKTISDAVPHAPQMRLGVGYEFAQRLMGCLGSRRLTGSSLTRSADDGSGAALPGDGVESGRYGGGKLNRRADPLTASRHAGGQQTLLSTV